MKTLVICLLSLGAEKVGIVSSNRPLNESTDDYRAENLGEPLERTVAAHSVSQIAHTPILTTGKISVSRVE